MPSSLPLFPLGFVLYPEERLPLHIYEERYKEMIAYCLDRDQPFGVVLLSDGILADMGCSAIVRRVLRRYGDGRLDIQAEGRERFRIERISQEKPYMTADVEPVREPDSAIDSHARERVITQHMKLLELAGRAVKPSIYEEVGLVSYLIAHNAGLTLEQKQAVLVLPTEDERIRFLVKHLEMFLPQLEQMESLRRKVKSNGHIRDFPPAAES